MARYTPHAASDGATTVTPHTTHACRSRPASKLRPLQRTHWISESCTGLLRGSGLSCSMTRASRTAKKLMCAPRARDTAPAPRGGSLAWGGPALHSWPAMIAAPTLGRKKAIEIAQHRRRRAPDEVAAHLAIRAGGLPRHRIELALHVVELELVALVVCRRHQECQRHFEGLGHFEAVQRQRERRLDQRDHRRDDEGGDGGIGRQLADHLDMAWPKADFFFGLAQRSGGGVLVVRLRAS